MSDVRFEICRGRPWSCQKLLYSFPRIGDSATDRRPTAAPSSPSSRLAACSFSTCSCSATSCAVRDARPSSCRGRSRGIAPSYLHTPCRSGSPHAVRGIVEEATSSEPSPRHASSVTTPASVSPATTCRYGIHQLRYLLIAPVEGSTTPSCPYINCSTNSTHLYSRICMSASWRR